MTKEERAAYMKAWREKHPDYQRHWRERYRITGKESDTCVVFENTNTVGNLKTATLLPIFRAPCVI